MEDEHEPDSGAPDSSDVNFQDDPAKDPSPPDRQTFVRTALGFYGAMGCLALFWRMGVSSESILFPGAGVAAEGSPSISTAVGAGLLVGLASLGISELFTRGTKLGDQLADLLGKSLVGLTMGDAMLLALASGMAEEMFFRGALQPAVGLAWASLIFGACHFMPRRELAIWSLYAVAMGFAFGWLFEWTGHLMAPVTAHVLVNGINLPRLARRYEQLTKG